MPISNIVINYDRKLKTRAAEMGQQTATIAIGKTMQWQGIIDIAGAKILLELIEVMDEKEKQLIAKDDAELKPYADALAALKDEPVTQTIPGMEPEEPKKQRKPKAAEPAKKRGRPRKVAV